MIYIDNPAYNRKTYGTAEKLLEELTVDGPWLTARYLAHRTGLELALVRRTLHRMYARGQVTKRSHLDSPGRHNGGTSSNEWRAL